MNKFKSIVISILAMWLTITSVSAVPVTNVVRVDNHSSVSGNAQSVKAKNITPVAVHQVTTDLSQVYRDALDNDPAFKQAEAQLMSVKELVPQSRAFLLPQIDFTSSVASSNNPETGYLPFNAIASKYLNRIVLNQSVFNFSYWKELAAAKNNVKAAQATYNAAVQNLMLRVANAYFEILKRQEVLSATEAEKRATAQQYRFAWYQQQVGLKTMIDVYNAKARYDTVVADVIVRKNEVAKAQEDLRAITGKNYDWFKPLSEKFTLIEPEGKSANQWVEIGVKQNWGLVAERYTTFAKKESIKSAYGGHVPTLDLVATLARSNQFDFVSDSYKNETNTSADLQFKIPLYSGGRTTSKVRQATAEYTKQVNKEDEAYRNVTKNTRQYYLDIISGISKVKADKQAIHSSTKSLEGTFEGYKVGTRNMVDVLIAEKTVYDAQRSYAVDRYNYVISTLSLKNAVGTLSVRDIEMLNRWLINQPKQTKLLENHDNIDTEAINLNVKENEIKEPTPAKKIKKILTKPSHKKAINQMIQKPSTLMADQQALEELLRTKLT